MAENLAKLPLPQFEMTPFVVPRSQREAKVAIVSTAGIHRRTDGTFRPGSSDYRLIPGDVEAGELVMSHVSVNFDRSGFAADANLVFPIELLRAMVDVGEIGALGSWHYSFMGATDPSTMAESGSQVGRLLRQDGVDIALLVPV